MTIGPDQLTNILEICVEFANEMLSKRGDFLPFGAHIQNDGNAGMVAGHIGEYPDKVELYKFLLDGFRSSVAKGDALAVALAVNVDIPAEYDPEFPDGIRVLVESEGYSRFIYFPYNLDRPKGLKRFNRHARMVTIAEPFAVEVPPSVFIQESGA
jgi:hypothetical protein